MISTVTLVFETLFERRDDAVFRVGCFASATETSEHNKPKTRALATMQSCRDSQGRLLNCRSQHLASFRFMNDLDGFGLK